MKRHKVLLLVPTLTTLLLSSCKKEEKHELTSGIIKQNMDTLVKPGDDFDAYVNGGWMKKNKIPSDKSSFGVDAILDDEAQANVKSIIEEAAKSNAKEGSNEQKIGDFYNSYMDQKTRDAKGITPLKPIFDQIDAITNVTELPAFFGKANKAGLSAPFSIQVTEDFKDPTTYMAFVWQGGLSLPEREYYMLQDAKSKEIRVKYEQHVASMLKLANIAEPELKAKEILALETRIASNHVKKEETRDATKMYNVFDLAALDKLSPGFDWTGFLKESGFGGQKKIILAQPSYISKVYDIIRTTPLEVWKTWLKWGAIHDNATYLSANLDNENFNFYGKVLSGTTKQRESWRRAVGAVNNNLGEVVGEQYVKKHFTPEAKERMSELVKNLLKAYEASIKELTWMTPETKKEALDKLSKFTPKIGYPDHWRDYSKLTVKKDDLFGNMQRSYEFEYNRMLDKLGKKVDKTEWGMTPQTVNAYYNPSLNEIVFPAAILQPPFFDLTADDAVNYGSIGAVIGHEIGHGFDDQGSTFDGNGVLRNWWTEADKKAFEQRTGALVKQYSSFKVFPDLNVNGAFTLGENIGDLGGLAIAFKAYKISLGGKPSPKIEGMTGEQRFFIGYAQSWLVKQREEALRTQVASDPHAPAHFRVNGIVRNTPEWYDAFNVKPGDSLYLAPADRVKIW
ncbi:M13 family metallopeptidase [Flavobacterium silvaticum]|uniref:M13 family metallopeptidase n=1 Tax=Flavobacterium silvaticum TaxID=1852020 RepID=A0A972FS07_9FLAO|nr:M13 family metallopeptidase [Flavobacterium silvaticum]NMH28294.1 M13 family metallopeptidase [Flavobacterium silvaticum]